eukprot:4381475-Amphidinium_carterae.1
MYHPNQTLDIIAQNFAKLDGVLLVCFLCHGFVQLASAILEITLPNRNGAEHICSSESQRCENQTPTAIRNHPNLKDRQFSSAQLSTGGTRLQALMYPPQKHPDTETSHTLLLIHLSSCWKHVYIVHTDMENEAQKGRGGNKTQARKEKNRRNLNFAKLTIGTGRTP